MSNEEKYELGFEIIAGMHAEIQDQDMEYGRLATSDGLTEDPECLTEYIKYHREAVVRANARIQKQAPFMADVAINKLAEMGYNLVNTQPKPQL